LEQELGATVSQRLATSLLGLSHTALAAGSAPAKSRSSKDMDGRTAVPVAELLYLYDAVERERASGERSRHLLEPTCRRDAVAPSRSPAAIWSRLIAARSTVIVGRR